MESTRTRVNPMKGSAETKVTSRLSGSLLASVFIHAQKFVNECVGELCHDRQDRLATMRG